MVKNRILAVDDEENILELVKYNLTREGFDVLCATSGEEALKAARKEPPDLLLLDLMLPGVNGMEVMRRLKSDAATKEIPIVMLTVKRDDVDVIMGLEMGADDYITKPFSPKVLVARVKAILRRKDAARQDRDSVIRRGDLVIDPGRHEVFLEGQAARLTVTEFRLLHLLAGRPGWVFTRNQIVNAIRGEDYSVTDRSVDAHVAALRKKLGPYEKDIETVRGVGYRFKA